MFKPKLVDMAKTSEEMQKDSMGCSLPVMAQDKYPYGLNICLNDESLAKLGLDADCEVGEVVHIFALAKVSSVSKNDTGEGEKKRVELQICMLGIESEDEENEEAEMEEDSEPAYRPDKSFDMKKFYNSDGE